MSSRGAASPTRPRTKCVLSSLLSNGLAEGGREQDQQSMELRVSSQSPLHKYLTVLEYLLIFFSAKLLTCEFNSLLVATVLSINLALLFFLN